MATTIKLKNGSGAPLAGDLVQGEPAFDLTNKRLYTEDSGGTVIEVGTNPTSLTTGTFTSTGIDDNATSTAITIDSSENVSVKTTTAGVAGLSVSNINNISFAESAGESIAAFWRQTSSAASVISYGYQRSATSNGFASAYSASLAKSAIVQDGLSIKFYADAAAAVAAGTDITPSERMRIDSSGNVGIGTSSPAFKLHTESSVSGDWLAQIHNTHATNGFGLKIRAGDDANVTALYVADVNNTGLFSVLGNGNVGIGIAPQQKLHVNGAIRFGSSGADVNRWSVYWNGSTGDLIVVSSDARLKKDFDYDIAGIETVNNLKPVRFTWKENNKRQLGFTAQESFEADEHLAWHDAENDQWGLDGWEGYAAVLTKAIQEQQVMIQDLKAEVAALKGA